MLSVASSSALVKILNYFSGSAFMQNFTLRVHKFSFKWDLFFHLSVCIFSLGPFGYTGNQAYTVLPLSVWGFYNVLFLIGSRSVDKLAVRCRSVCQQKYISVSLGAWKRLTHISFPIIIAGGRIFSFLDSVDSSTRSPHR